MSVHIPRAAVGVIVLGMAGWATAQLVVPSRHGQTASHTPFRPGTAPPPPHAVEADEDNPLIISGLSLRDTAASVEGGVVTVSATADVFDRTRGRAYIWMMRIYTHAKVADRKLLAEHHYVDQAVAMPEGRIRMAPEFRDAFPLDPGTYQILLLAYSVPPGFDHTTLRRGEDFYDRMLSRAQTWYVVTVP
jgi:hypothetical protein